MTSHILAPFTSLGKAIRALMGPRYDQEAVALGYIAGLMKASHLIETAVEMRSDGTAGDLALVSLAGIHDEYRIVSDQIRFPSQIAAAEVPLVSDGFVQGLQRLYYAPYRSFPGDNKWSVRPQGQGGIQ